MNFYDMKWTNSWWQAVSFKFYQPFQTHTCYLISIRSQSVLLCYSWFPMLLSHVNGLRLKLHNLTVTVNYMCLRESVDWTQFNNITLINRLWTEQVRHIIVHWVSFILQFCVTQRFLSWTLDPRCSFIKLSYQSMGKTACYYGIKNYHRIVS